MVKKILIGCGIVFLLGVIVSCLAVFFVVSKAKKFADNLQQIEQNFKANNESFPFTPPDPPIMESWRIQGYLRVRDGFMQSIEDQHDIIDKFEEWEKKGDDVNPREVFQGMVGFLKSAKEVADSFVEELNRNQMSVKEYMWHSSMITGTILKAVEYRMPVGDDLLKPYKEWADRMNELELEEPSGRRKQFTIQDIQEQFGVRNVPFHQQNLNVVMENREGIARMQKIGVFDYFIRMAGYESTYQPPPGSQQGTPAIPGQMIPGQTPPGGPAPAPGANPFVLGGPTPTPAWISQPR